MKVAILGSALHCVKAPFSDPSWEIWGANGGTLPRWDRWFELHSDESIAAYPGHRERLAASEKPVYLRQVAADIPAGIEYPIAQMTAKYGDWFFTSTIAYMMALAIEMPGVTDIGLWGVDCAHAEEYLSQKPGVRFFIQVARMAGITVTMPEEAEVAVPGRLYCYDDGKSLLRVKIDARVTELRGRLAACQKNREDLAQRKFVLHGGLSPELRATDPRMIQEKIDAILSAEAEQERAALLIDGALQEAEHHRLNWFGD